MRLRKAIEQAVEGRQTTTPSRQPSPGVEPEEITIELADVPDWVMPYRVVTPVAPRIAAAIHEGAAQNDLQRMIFEVVRGEGPLAIEIVLRRVREQWGMNRAGSRARSAFDTAVRALRRRNDIVSESEGFLVLPNQGAVPVRGGDKDDPDTVRTIHEIPPSELRQAIIRFVREVHAITDDELSARVSAVFGWNRRGADISHELKKVIRKLVAAGALQRNDDRLTVVEESERT